MRRSERSITKRKELLEILNTHKVCRIAIHDQPFPYIVPLNYCYEEEGGDVFLYVHCAKEGRKIELLRKNQHIGFEIDGQHQLLTGETACSHSYAFESIIGSGLVEFLDDPETKRQALLKFMQHQTSQDFPDIPDAAVGAVEVIRISVKELCGKRHAPPQST